MTRLIPLFVFALLLAGCGVSNTKFFSHIHPTADPTYGYTPENPIQIKNAGLSKSISATHYFLSSLKTDSGKRLVLIVKNVVSNPTYQKLEFTPYNGESPISKSTGPLLDKYMFRAENTLDTITLFVNAYLKDDVRIPMGLVFEPQPNQ